MPLVFFLPPAQGDAGPPWWDAAYEYRLNIALTAEENLTAGTPANLTVDHAGLVTADKSLASGDDLRVVHWTGSAWEEVNRSLHVASAWNSSSTTVWFRLRADLTADVEDEAYYLYYGNPNATSPDHPPQAGSYLRSLQTGTADLGTNPRTVTLSAVNTSRAVALCSYRVSGSSMRRIPTCEIAGATSLVVEAPDSYSSTVVEWQVVEFDDGVQVQRGVESLGFGEVSRNVTLSPVDRNRTFILVGSRGDTGSSSQDERRVVRGRLANETILEIARGEGGLPIDVVWQAVELETAQVQWGTTSLAPGTTSALATLPRAVTPSSTLLLFSSRADTNVDGEEARYYVRGALSNATTVDFTRRSSSGTVDLSWFVVSLSGATGQHGNATASTTETVQDVTIATVDSSHAIVLGSADVCENPGCTEDPSDQDSGLWSLRLTTETSLRLERGSSQSRLSTVSWSVVELPVPPAIAASFGQEEERDGVIMTYSVQASASSAEPGEAVVYWIGFSNTGLGTATIVWVNASLPTELQYLGDDAAGVGGQRSGTYFYAFDDVAPGSYAFNFTVAPAGGVSDGTVAVLNFTFAARDAEGRPLPSSWRNEPLTVRNAVIVPALRLDRAEAERGDEVVATLFYNNTGTGSAHQAWANWTLAADFELLSLSSDGGYAETSDGFAVTLGAVVPGPHAQTARLLVTRGMEDGLLLGLVVTWEARDGAGSSLSSASRLGGVELLAPAVDLELEASETRVARDGAFVLNLTVRNTGRAPAQGWVNLTLPQELEYLGHDGPFSVDALDGTSSWELSPLAEGEAVTLSVHLRPVGAEGLYSFRFALDYTDGKGSATETVQSNVVFVEFISPPPPSFPPLPGWWPLLLVVPALGVGLLLLHRRVVPRIEEVFVVHRSGVLLAHRSKTLTPDKDQDILVALLKTVQDFAQQAFSEHGETPMRSLQFEGFNILLERGDNHYVSIVYQGRDDRALRARVARLSRQIERQFGEVLEAWSGNMLEVKGINALLPTLWEARSSREAGEVAAPREGTMGKVLMAFGGMGRRLAEKVRSLRMRRFQANEGVEDAGGEEAGEELEGVGAFLRP